MINIKKQDPVADVVKDILQQEALKGNQHKIDKNKNNKIDAHDFKILRGEKPEVKEGWDDMLKAGKERAERERQEMGTGKFDKREVKPGVVQYTKKPVKYEPAEKTQKEEVEQVEEVAMPPAVIKAKEKIRMASAEENKKRFAGKSKGELSQMARRHGYGEKNPYAKFHDGITEEVEHVQEGLMTNIEVKPMKNNDSDLLAKHSVHYKGKKIGHIETYQHRTGIKYGDHCDATGDATAGHRSMDDAIASLRSNHAEHLKSMKEEVEQVQEREMTSGETAERERIVKGMKKTLKGFKARYGERAKSVMYATATKNAMKEESIEEGKRPEDDSVPFAPPYNTTSSPAVIDKSGAKHTPVSRVKHLAKMAMKKISSDLKDK